MCPGLGGSMSKPSWLAVGLMSCASTSCQSSWHPDSDDVQYTPYKSSIWANVDFNYGRTASMNSQRYDLRVCEDEPLFLADICGGSRVLGIDWN